MNYLSAKKISYLLIIVISVLFFTNCGQKSDADENRIPNNLADAVDMFDVGPRNLYDLPNEVLEKFDINRYNLCKMLKQQHKDYYGYDKFQDVDCNSYK
ncbi:hypothetical protein [Bartonella sp. PS17NMGDW]|uniref:hypothetical protein n=1 Tax=Bartonella sp. PS17NMGDW TaxID=3243573 RepID=UPI0035CE94DA